MKGGEYLDWTREHYFFQDSIMVIMFYLPIISYGFRFDFAVGSLHRKFQANLVRIGPLSYMYK